MSRETFAEKLRLTAAVLGCTTRKDLCARFRAVNPLTLVDVERANKWLQGRALPRSHGVYEDWAKLIGTPRPASWLAACTVEAFLEELARLFGVDPAALRARAARSGRAMARAPAAVLPAAAGAAHLHGHYACYSWAWSPYFRGRLIRGALHLRPGAPGTLRADYTEQVMGRAALFAGDVVVGARSLQLSLRGTGETEMALFVALFLPGPPASAMCGMMAGTSLVAPDPQPSSTRFVALRVPASPQATNRYLEPDESIAADLAAQGLRLGDAVALDTLLAATLAGPDGRRPGMDLIAASEQTRLAEALDPLHLDAAPRREPAA